MARMQVSEDIATGTNETAAKLRNTREELEREQLQDEALALIQPYLNTLEKPPLSTGELIVLGSLIDASQGSGCKTFTAESISRWISRTFHGTTQRPLFCEIVPGFQKCWQSYDLPLQADARPSPGKFFNHTAGKFFIETNEARLYLRRLLEPARKGIFEFLDLPAEIRNSIYEYTLSFEGDIHLDTPRSQDITMCASSRSNGSSIRSEGTLLLSGRQKIILPNLEAWLGILRVSKKLYKEAMPLFYNLNTFYFTNPMALCSLLQALPMDQKRHITSVGLYLDPPHAYDQINCFLTSVNYLESLPSLSKLNLGLYQADDWLEVVAPEWFDDDMEEFKRYGDIPKMKVLAHVASKKEYNVQGDCEAFKNFIQGGADHYRKAREIEKK